MIEPVTEQRIKLLHPKIRDEVRSIIEKIQLGGVTIRIVQGFRSFDEQNKIYAQGRTQAQLNAVRLNNVIAQPTLPKVSNAMGYQSWHCWGLAIDFCLFHGDKSISWSQVEDLDKDGKADWLEVIETFGLAGYESGLYWKFTDPPHLEKKFGLTLQQCLCLKNSGKIDKDGYILIT